MSGISFDYDRPRRSDFHLVIRAIKSGWPIAQETRDSLIGFCMKAKLDGRTDRIIELANQTLDMLTESIEKTTGKVPEQTRLTTNPDDKPRPSKAA